MRRATFSDLVGYWLSRGILVGMLVGGGYGALVGLLFGLTGGSIIAGAVTESIGDLVGYCVFGALVGGTVGMVTGLGAALVALPLSALARSATTPAGFPHLAASALIGAVSAAAALASTDWLTVRAPALICAVAVANAHRRSNRLDGLLGARLAGDRRPS